MILWKNFNWVLRFNPAERVAIYMNVFQLTLKVQHVNWSEITKRSTQVGKCISSYNCKIILKDVLREVWDFRRKIPQETILRYDENIISGWVFGFPAHLIGLKPLPCIKLLFDILCISMHPLIYNSSNTSLAFLSGVPTARKTENRGA